VAYVSILDFHFKPEKLDEAIAFYQRILKDTRAFTGCLNVEVVQDIDDATHVQFVEHWDSLEHLGAYRDWRAGAGAIPESAAFLVRPRTVSTLKPLPEI
jgi:quinol monooxygenase YgiN